MKFFSEKKFHCFLVLCRRAENKQYLAEFFWKTLSLDFENSEGALLLALKRMQIYMGREQCDREGERFCEHLM